MNKLGFKNTITKNKGRPPYNPKNILNLYICGYVNKVISSTKLEKATQTNIEIM